MTARHPPPSDPGTGARDAEPATLPDPMEDPTSTLRELLSAVADWLGLGWGLFLGLLVPTAVVLLAGMVVTGVLWRRTRRAPSRSTGPDLFVGRVVTVDHAEGRRGQTFVEGSWWTVRSTGPALRAGQDVRVRALDGLVLVVEETAADTANEEET